MSTTPLQMGQTNSSFSANTNFKECWMEVSSASQEPAGPVDLILDSSDLTDSSDCKLDSFDPPSFVLAVAMNLRDDTLNTSNR